MRNIDLNCDMGESFGVYTLGLDEEVIKYISSANVACGWHAGDARVMNRTVQLAKSHNVGVGAHPGYPDLPGFGRRNMDCTGEEVRDYVIYQVGALLAFCAANGVPLRHVKPHGSLYLTAVNDAGVAEAVAEAVVSVNPDLLYVALAGAGGDFMRRVAEKIGLKVVYEAFADRAYTSDGKLLPRRQPGAVITNAMEVTERALRMAKEGKVIAVDGTSMDLEIDTLCVHGDNPGAVELVKSIRTALESEGVIVQPMSGRPN
ncbi:MAG TPA: 5-oxoprolinase subunit PxpA [Desulfomonilaceae bacterium]|nr:5-oxoprolinase subunit PxpA [Desulfomonilaceae bacterium]